MYIELLILIQIEKGPRHGYEIKKQIQHDIGYLTDINHNMLYPTLRRFAEEGLVTKRLNEQAGRPNQTIYELTKLGEKKITELVNRFSEKEAKSQVEFLIRVSLFHHITAENQLRILSLRRQQLDTLEADLLQRQEQREPDTFREEVLNLSLAQITGEKTWIDQLMGQVKGE